MENQVSVPLQGNQIECFVPFVNTTIVWGLYDIQYLNIKNKKGKTSLKYMKVYHKYIYIYIFFFIFNLYYHFCKYIYQIF